MESNWRTQVSEWGCEWVQFGIGNPMHRVIYAARLNPPWPVFAPVWDKLICVDVAGQRRLYLSPASLGEYVDDLFLVNAFPVGSFPYGWSVDPD